MTNFSPSYHFLKLYIFFSSQNLCYQGKDRHSWLDFFCPFSSCLNVQIFQAAIELSQLYYFPLLNFSAFASRTTIWEIPGHRKMSWELFSQSNAWKACRKKDDSLQKCSWWNQWLCYTLKIMPKTFEGSLAHFARHQTKKVKQLWMADEGIQFSRSSGWALQFLAVRDQAVVWCACTTSRGVSHLLDSKGGPSASLTNTAKKTE